MVENVQMASAQIKTQTKLQEDVSAESMDQESEDCNLNNSTQVSAKTESSINPDDWSEFPVNIIQFALLSVVNKNCNLFY